MQESKRCGAKTRNGTPCQNWAMSNGKCRMHGGLTPGGLACANYKHGRYSEYLPARLLERYNEAADDPDLLALRQEVALVDSRLADLLKQVDTGESGKLWSELKGAWQVLVDAKGTAAKTVAITTLGRLITYGVEDRATWRDISGTITQRRRLVESERKRLLEMQQFITAERAMILMGAIVDVIRKNVTDRDTLVTITSELGKLAATGGG